MESGKEEILNAGSNFYCEYLFDGTFYSVKEVNDNKIKGVCELCKKKKKETIISGLKTVTSNFNLHIKRVHPESFKDLEEHKKNHQSTRNRKRKKEPQCDVNNPATNQRKMVQSTLNSIGKTMVQANFDRNVLNYIVKGIRPLSTVESPEFRQIIFDLDKDVKVPCRRTLSRRIDEEYLSSNEKIKEELGKVPFICSTADIWSTKTRSFLGVTAHWINEAFERKSTVLACRRFPGSHTYDRIAEVLYDINTSYGLNTDKIVSTVTDNGTNFVKAFQEFGVQLDLNVDDGDDNENNIEPEIEFTKLEEEGSEDGNEADEDFSEGGGFVLPHHIRCSSHTLNLLATTDATKILKESKKLSSIHHTAMGKCTALWNAAGRPKSSETITSVLGCKLSYPCKTR